VSDNKLILEGIFQVFETRNTGRIYPSTQIVIAINRMNKIKKIFNVGG